MKLTHNGIKVVIEVPYSATFVNDIKSAVPAKFRSYDPATRRWVVYNPYVGTATHIVHRFFPAVEEVGNRPESADEAATRVAQDAARFQSQRDKAARAEADMQRERDRKAQAAREKAQRDASRQREREHYESTRSKSNPFEDFFNDYYAGQSKRANGSSSRSDARYGANGGGSVSDDHKTLGVLPGADPDVIAAAYRALSKKHHPDKGGNVGTMERINAAYSRITGGK